MNRGSRDDAEERLLPTRATLDEVLRRHPDHRQRYEFAKRHVAGRRVADVACGAGYGSFMLASSAQEVVGFDIDPVALRHAEIHFKVGNTRFAHLDEIAGECFDVIVSLETIEHMTETDGDRFLRLLGASLCADGRLIISTPINRSDHRVDVTPYHLREYNEPEFASKLRANGFRVTQWLGQGPTVLMQPLAGRLSIGKVMRSGLHRLLPRTLRRQVAAWLIRKPSTEEGVACCIMPDTLEGASVQIAVCELARAMPGARAMPPRLPEHERPA